MTSEQEVLVAKPVVRKQHARLVTVEPVVFMVLAIQGGFVALRTLFIEHRLALSYNYTLPSGEVNTTCGGNVTKDLTQVRIESETALWVAYMKGISVFLPLFGALVYGAVSDFIGRKPILIISATGHLAASGLFLCVVFFNLPLFWLVVGEGVLGICGDVVVLQSTSLAYVTDIYQGKERSFRIFLVDVMVYVGFGCSQLAVTSILRLTESNFFIAYLTLFGTGIVNFLYVTIPCVLHETVEKRPFSRGVLRDLITKIYHLFKKNANSRRLTIVLLIANIILYEMVYDAVYSVVVIYGLGPPFCWSEILVGLYAVIVNVIPALVSILAMKLLGLCISVYWMVYIGFLSGIGSMVMTSLAGTTPLLAYVASSVGILHILPLPLMTFLAAQQVDADEQGSLFGAIAVFASLGKVLSPITMNGIYSSTVKIGHPTVTFYVAAGILCIPLVIHGFLHARQSQQGYELISSSDNETDSSTSLVPVRHNVKDSL